MIETLARLFSSKNPLNWKTVHLYCDRIASEALHSTNNKLQTIITHLPPLQEDEEIELTLSVSQERGVLKALAESTEELCTLQNVFKFYGKCKISDHIENFYQSSEVRLYLLRFHDIL